jgi:hypothetical protein
LVRFRDEAAALGLCNGALDPHPIAAVAAHQNDVA